MKHNTETNTTAARGCETYTCATENPELGMFCTGEQMNHKTCPEIFIIVFVFLYAENIGIQNMPKSYE